MTRPTPTAGGERLPELVEELAAAGIRLSLLDGDRLRVSAPRGAVGADLRERLATAKPSLLAHLRAVAVAAGPIRPLPRDGGGLPLAPSQRALWLLDQLDGHRPTYVITGGVRFDGPLDADRLGRCLGVLAERHETLRTAFRTDPEGNPVQVVLPPRPVDLPVLDLQRSADPDAEVARHAAAAAGRPFDLAAGRLLRANLFRLGPGTAHLVLSVHHIVADAWSLGVLFRELFALYRAGADPSVLPALPVQYADVAGWQHDALSPVEEQRQLGYWRERLAGAPPLLELPTDRPRPDRQSFRGAVERFDLDGDAAAQVRELAGRLGATPYAVLLAAWAAVLGRYARTGDVVVGSPVAARDRPETAGLVGFFVNTLAWRIDASGGPTFGELVHRVRDVCLDGLARKDIPFERLVADLRPDRSLGHTPVFQAMFVLYQAPYTDVVLGPVTASPGEVPNSSAKFDLTLLVEEHGGGLRCALEYATDLFDPDTVRGIAGSWRRALLAGLADPDTPADRLPLLDGRQRHELVEGWNATGTDADLDRPVHRIVTEAARRTPDATAVVLGAQSLSYAGLETAANRLAHLLRRHGVGPDVLVALCAQRSVRLVVGMLAVLKAGGAFVALDPESPPDRLAFTLADAGAPLLLTDTTVRTRLSIPDGVRTLLLDGPDGGSDAGPDPGLEVAAPRGPGTGRDDLAYVIYTSGSTGRPKGVAMRHEGLTNMVAWQTRRTPFAADDRVLQFAPLNFDICLQEGFAVWAAGGTLVLVSEQVRRDIPALLRYLLEERITRLFLPYVVLQQLAEVAAARGLWPVALRDIFAAGEQLHLTPQLGTLLDHVPATLHNHYGPTEAHVVTAYTLTGRPADWPALPPVGRPIDNVRIYLLDEHREPVPRGVPGEVYVAGPCLARGYLHRPELTGAVFVPDPFRPGMRMYRTGDLARLGADGELRFLGRIDQQVKVRGFRVELGEVETVLMRHPDIREAVADVRGNGADQRLVAWVVPQPGRPLDPAAVRRHCADTLPQYMVPGVVVALDALPLTNAGKIERGRLPEPAAGQRAAAAGYREPATPLEKSVALAVAEVLDLDRVGAEDDFFDLGGHSLAATRLALRLGAEHGVELPVGLVFERPTVAGIARSLDLMRWAAAGGPGPAAEPAGADREVGEL